MICPHLENPQDFPKPVFIRKDLCRDTPQLIYINVVAHLERRTNQRTKYKTYAFSNQNIIFILTKKRNILIVVGIASLLLIAITISIGTSTEKKANSKNSGQIQVGNRILYVYEFDSIKSITDYKLKIIEKDSVKIFKYKNANDSTRNIVFRYNKLNSNLYFGPDKLNVTEFNKYRTEFNFDKYELTEPIIDGIGPILFNKNYGILAWDNNWGNQFYFVNDENINKIKLPIFKYNSE